MRFISKAVRAAIVVTFVFGIVSFVQGQGVKIQPGTAPPSVPGGINQTPWFANPQVRQHLNLNENQYGGLNKAYQNAWTNYQKGLTNLDKTLPTAQYQQRAGELRQNFYQDFSGAQNKILTDPTQRQRYEQLHRQYQGYGAFADPAVADQLKLTPAQRKQLNQYHQEWSTQMNRLGSLYQTDRDQVTGQFTRLQGQNGNRINSVLTPQQQAAWGRMTGNPYAFSPDVYFGANMKTIGGGKK